MGHQPWCDLVRVKHLPTSQSQSALLFKHGNLALQVTEDSSSGSGISNLKPFIFFINPPRALHFGQDVHVRELFAEAGSMLEEDASEPAECLEFGLAGGEGYSLLGSRPLPPSRITVEHGTALTMRGYFHFRPRTGIARLQGCTPGSGTRPSCPNRPGGTPLPQQVGLLLRRIDTRLQHF